MGLEDIVNFLLKPIESITRFVYDSCFVTEVQKEVIQKDGKNVTVSRKKYSGSDIQKAFETMGEDYRTVKEFLLKYTLRPVDTVAAATYNGVEAPVKALYETLDTKIFTPITKYVKENPWKTAALISLPLALYTSSLFYAAGYPLYA